MMYATNPMRAILRYGVTYGLIQVTIRELEALPITVCHGVLLTPVYYSHLPT